MSHISLKHRIGLVYVPGALPCFEDFGNLPTDIVGGDGRVRGQPASEVLDMLIIPGGSLVESGSITGDLAREIVKMAEGGKYLLGICAGFQVLAKSTDTGRLSPTPIIRQGLGLLDVEFEPLICTDRVSATITGQSFMTENVGSKVTGFHCHTYGKITLGDDARLIMVSHVKRVNYRNDPQDLISGVSNKKGNIVGVLVHGLLDENPAITSSIAKSLGITSEEFEEIRKVNAALKARLKSEVGISTGWKVQDHPKVNGNTRGLLFTAVGSGAGKTFVLAGVAGALKRRGIHVGVLKVGGDIRDIVPSLYLIKEPIRHYSSIRLGSSGWMPLNEAFKAASGDYQLLLIEGAMGDLTGLLNMMVEHPFSTIEVALAMNLPVILVAACDKGGIEGAITDTVHHIDLLKGLGVNVVGVILNKVRLSYMTKDIRFFIEKALSLRGVGLLGVIPRLEMTARGMIPEVEIRYEDFGGKALESV
ncbi:AAA family ATPase, partial [Candidatus Bathyarchaeota archaeon]|nr:AAA family ATPase [Candidatus Bathyarchaeota archaeon]